MNKLEVGMYVRTNKGEISKIIADSSCWVNIDKFKKDGITLRMLKKKDILKASHNIIDLIEVGDYVNGEKVGYINDKRELLFCTMMKEHNSNWINEEDIKSIVTKEQFEQMEYKVGE